jgi:proline-specific peptidase
MDGLASQCTLTSSYFTLISICSTTEIKMVLVEVPVQEGYIELRIPNLPKPCKTWYRIVGRIGPDEPRPLIILHGGPGVPHNYMDSLKDLAFPPYNRPVIHYDQLGCGRSTHLPEVKGKAGVKFWTVELFLAEFEALVQTLGIQNSYDVLGNSWGGMLGAEIAIRQPKGLHKLVIADAPADMHDWVRATNKLRRELPKDVQETLDRCERDGETDSKQYRDAMLVFYRRHAIRMQPWPDEVAASFKLASDDPTVYETMNGRSEFETTGSLKDWNIKGQLHKIKIPVLLINGRYDEAQDEVLMPYFNRIEHVKWVQFADSAHMPHVEERQRYMEIVNTFLSDGEEK